MQTAQHGHYVKIHYTAKLISGEVVGTSKNGQPLALTIGKGKLIPKLEQGLIGMRVGETRRIELSPEEGYGERDDTKVIKVKKTELPTKKDIAVGRTVQFMNESSGMVNLMITEVGEETVTLDANHPFAGNTLNYEVVLLAVSDKRL